MISVVSANFSSSPAHIKQFSLHSNVKVLDLLLNLSARANIALRLLLFDLLKMPCLALILALLNEFDCIMRLISISILVILPLQTPVFILQNLKLVAQLVNLLVFLLELSAIICQLSLQIIVLLLHVSNSLDHFLTEILLIF